jgi:hypothetical protein
MGACFVAQGSQAAKRRRMVLGPSFRTDQALLKIAGLGNMLAFRWLGESIGLFRPHNGDGCKYRAAIAQTIFLIVY